MACGSGRGRWNERGLGRERERRRRTAGLGLTAACAAWLVLGLTGCGGTGEAADPARLMREGERATLEGSYRVKGSEGGEVLGVGAYDNGSFRVIIEGTPTMVIYDAGSGKGWLVNFHTKTYKEISYDEAARRAGFMPHVVTKPYFEVDRYWGEDGFSMDAPDGRSIRIRLDGPGNLPSAFEVRSRDGIVRRIDWEYRGVGSVSPENFRLPEGLQAQT